jgi:hypothetical protein
MESIRRTAPGAALGLVFSLALLGCNDEGAEFNPPAGPPGGIGLVETVPEIAGSWLATATVTSNSCGAPLDVPPDEMLLEIAQADTMVEIALITPCEGNTGTSTGSLTTDNILSVTSERTEIVGVDCSLEMTAALVATASDLGDSIDGSLTVDVTPAEAPANDCGPGFPCSYELMLAAVPCPGSGCVLAACPVAPAP